MDRRMNYPELVKRILTEYAEAYSKGYDWPLRTIFDDRQQRYLLMDIGWRMHEYTYNPVIHIDIIDGCFWIQHDDTEEGVATDLLEAGVPREDIVLGFRPPDLRPYTEFGTGTPAAQHGQQFNERAA